VNEFGGTKRIWKLATVLAGFIYPLLRWLIGHADAQEHTDATAIDSGR
jgi:hypothetical protein